MGNLNAANRLIGNMQAAHGEMLAGTLAERGRGFASDREAWALLKECIENVEARMKTVKDLHKDMWGAVKDRNGDAFCALSNELQRSAMLLATEWVTAGVMANIATLSRDAKVEDEAGGE